MNKIGTLETKLFEHIIEQGHSNDCQSLKNDSACVDCNCHYEALVDLYSLLGNSVRDLDMPAHSKEMSEKWSWPK